MMIEDRERLSDRTAFFRWVLVALLGVTFAAAIFAAGFVTGSQFDSLNLFGSAGFTAPLPASEPLVQGEEDTEDVDMSVFWEVWATLEDRFYYEVPSEEERVQGAIQGLIQSLDDPYTAYIPPDLAAVLREDTTGEFEGIGAFVEEAPEGGVQIIRVFEEGPAEQAGMEAGDIVVAVDGQDVTGMILNEALLLIRGEAGTTVRLTVFRMEEDEMLEFSVTRERLLVPTVESEMLEDNVGYVALFQFNAIATRELRAAVEDLMNQGAESIILDIRNNPGGFLDEAVSVADLFLPRGIVLIERNVDGREQTFRTRSGDIAEDVPLVVLVNENSASASEIVAAAVQDNGRGTLIGETTFGKGSVQLLYNLSDGSQLRVTYANWYTPDDVSISENGVEPDIVVEADEADTSADDVQLERALEFLQSGQ